MLVVDSMALMNSSNYNMMLLCELELVDNLYNCMTLMVMLDNIDKFVCMDP